ncbi:MAG TPA: DMT family transporter [Acidimicrobiia bacterium]
MEVLLGGLSSILYGFADFLGGEASKKVTSATVVVWSGVLAFPFLLVVGLVIGGDAGLSDYLYGAASGMSGAVGLVMLFAGLARGRAAVVAPLAAALGAVVPVVAGILSGDRPSMTAWAGVVLAVPAIALSAWVEDAGGSIRDGLLFGSIAGISFGAFATLIAQTSQGSNLLPLVVARGSLVVLIVVLSMAGVWAVERRFSQTPRSFVAANSILDVTANVSLLYALRSGSLALAAVAGSFYPAVTVILARTVNGEHLRRRQIAGIALTLFALALIALG